MLFKLQENKYLIATVYATKAGILCIWWMIAGGMAVIFSIDVMLRIIESGEGWQAIISQYAILIWAMGTLMFCIWKAIRGSRWCR